jgi:hypothetical protein
VILLVRHPKPIHARGVVLTGALTWHGRTELSGLRWIDEPPSHRRAVTARVSRSIGLPPQLPDIVGLAVRIDDDDGFADLELASTGFGVPSRFWLVPHRSPSRARFTVLLPYRTARGAVLIAARTLTPQDLPAQTALLSQRLDVEPWRLRLYWARPGGRWRAFADLELRHPGGSIDADLRFDAVRHPLPGAGTYDWVRALRQPAYRRAQRPTRNRRPTGR